MGSGKGDPQGAEPYVVQVVLNLAQGGLRDFDVAGLPLVLPQLPQGRHVVHGMAQGVVVLVHQAKALQGTGKQHHQV